MPIQRGLVPPAIVGSTIALIGCSIAWGALGVISFADPGLMSTAAHRYLCILLATATLGGAMVNLSARIVRVIRHAHGLDEPGDGESYADGYAAGLAARPVSPAVTRLTPTRR